MRFDNKIAVVTGAARGIGMACAVRLLADGAKVVIADIDGDALSSAAAALGSPDRVHATVTDVSSEQQVDALVAEAVAVFGGIDIMVNNAGIAMVQDFLDITEADYEAVLAVNLKGGYAVSGRARSRPR